MEEEDKLAISEASRKLAARVITPSFLGLAAGSGIAVLTLGCAKALIVFVGGTCVIGAAALAAGVVIGVRIANKE